MHAAISYGLYLCILLASLEPNNCLFIYLHFQFYQPIQLSCCEFSNTNNTKNRRECDNLILICQYTLVTV